MNIGIVTTFSDQGYKQYGRNFLLSLYKYLDPSIKIFLYLDNTNIIEGDSRTLLFDLEKENLELRKFKERHRNYKPKDFKSDAVRFAHKSFAMYHASKQNIDKLFWLDGDTEIIEKISFDYLTSFLPNNFMTSYIGRPDYTETGYLGFNLSHPNIKDFFEKFINYYVTDEIFSLDGQTDCHAFDSARVYIENNYKIENKNLTPPNLSKNHFNIIFDGYMLHYKGGRKDKKEKLLQKALKRKNT